MVTVWIHGVGEEASRSLPLLAAGLRRRGLEPRLEQGPGPGVLLFDEPGAATSDAIREAALFHRARVLAVSRSPAGSGDRSCWQLLRAGASDVVTWDGGEPSLLDLAQRLERWCAVEALLESPRVREHLVGRSLAWLGVLRPVIEVAAFTEASVLLLGESGTGKEEIARLIHDLDPRPARRELVTLDCTTVVPELSGSEFFGHEKGAFTGAVSTRDGALALADGGTLFLDEVGELPLALQAQLLRAVQERTYKRVGGNLWQQSRFRLICATNRELPTEVTAGKFRGDLLHRITTYVFRLPALHERTEDVLPLAAHFLHQLRPEPALELDPTVREYLLGRSYPGNVRELRQVITRLASRHVGTGPITAGEIPPEEWPAEAEPGNWQDEGFVRAIRRALACGVGLKELGRIVSDLAVRVAIADEQGSLQRAAQRLGVTDRALQIRRAQGSS